MIEHITHPFPGYDYRLQRWGSNAFRAGYTLFHNPFNKDTEMGKWTSWRYGWYMEKQLEEACPMPRERPPGWQHPFIWGFISGAIAIELSIYIIDWIIHAT